MSDLTSLGRSGAPSEDAQEQAPAADTSDASGGPTAPAPGHPESPPTNWSPARLLAGATIGSWVLLILLWCLHVLRLAPTLFAGRLVLSLCLVLTAACTISLLRRALRHNLARALAGLGLLLLALSIRLVGITHELVEQAYLDEGTYLHHASEIDRGHWYRGSFVYPHLVYNLGAFGFWVAELGEPFSTRITEALVPSARSAPGSEGEPATPSDASTAHEESASTPSEDYARNRLVLRLTVALLSAFATAPVAYLGYQLGGPLVGLLSGGLWIFSPLVNEGAHLVISDWPAAAFAAACLAFVARWYERPTRGVALLAGACAGLAAGAKYPGGMVAVAIVAVWLSHQGFARSKAQPRDQRVLGLRRPGDLLLSTLAALATFLGTSPSFFVSPQHALFAPRGMLFGLRQYAGGGWLGVQPESNLGFYAAQLATDTGWFTMVAAALGLALLLQRPSPTRRRLLLLAPFPVLYLVLLASMSMVVKRNLAPAMPAVLAFVALGLFVVIARLTAASQRVATLRRRAARTALVLALAGILLGPSILETVRQSVALSRPSTRDLATKHIATHLPPGVRLLKESYTPRLRGLPHLQIHQARFLARRPLDELLGGRYDYLLAASSANFRFLRDDAQLEGHHLAMAERYRAVFDQLPVVWRAEPGRWRQGPDLQLLAVSTAKAPTSLAGTALASAATLPDASMRHDEGIAFTRPGQWALLRLLLERGTQTLRLEGAFRPHAEAVPGGAELGAHVRVVSTLQPTTLEAAAEKASQFQFDQATAKAPIQSTQSGIHMLYVFLPQGSLVRQVTVRAAAPPSAGEAPTQ